MKRRKEAENLLEDKKKLLEWEKRLDQEEILVRNLLNEALKLESSRKIRRVSSLTSEDDEHRGDKNNTLTGEGRNNHESAFMFLIISKNYIHVQKCQGHYSSTVKKRPSHQRSQSHSRMHTCARL